MATSKTTQMRRKISHKYACNHPYQRHSCKVIWFDYSKIGMWTCPCYGFSIQSPQRAPPSRYSKYSKFVWLHLRCRSKGIRGQLPLRVPVHSLVKLSPICKRRCWRGNGVKRELDPPQMWGNATHESISIFCLGLCVRAHQNYLGECSINVLLPQIDLMFHCVKNESIWSLCQYLCLPFEAAHPSALREDQKYGVGRNEGSVHDLRDR